MVYDNEVKILSGILKSISHPIRLKIMCLLRDRELTVGDIHNEVRTSNANVSQHLGILRNQGLIGCRRDANFIYNRITDERMVKLIKTMQELFCE